MLLGLLFACSNTDVTNLEGYTDGESYFVVVETEPSPVPFNEEFSTAISVYANDIKEQTISAITVDVDSSMPAHGHGMNQSPTMSGPTNGVFTADGLLWHMEGEWEITVYVSGESNEYIAFSMDCCQ